jgi:hypothetical protein
MRHLFSTRALVGYTLITIVVGALLAYGAAKTWAYVRPCEPVSVPVPTPEGPVGLFDLSDTYTRCVLALDGAEVDSVLCDPLLAG